MIILKTEAPKDRYFSDEQLDSDDIKKLEELGFDLVAYWYSRGAYEGQGQILGRKEGHFYHHDMGHCSCYGPVERFDGFEPSFASLDLLLERSSSEQGDNIRPLVNAIKEYLSKQVSAAV